ncbi:restriction endonuclease subunit S [Sporosarcina koreensis]|uniref:Restriction endonuclease subunit S n=1 Tax=Sporosarcina koreensis TaxID=334735 RepID=A0ABW0TWF3_9BACL
MNQNFKQVKLKYLALINPPKSEVKIKENIPVSFVPMENIKSIGEVDLSIVRPIEEVWDGYTYFKDKDIIMAKVTPCFENGNIAIVDNLENGVGFGTTELHIIRAHTNVKTEFLFYFIQSDEFKTAAVSSMYGVGGLKRIPTEFLLNSKVPLPDKETQRRIISFLNEKSDSIHSLIKKKQKLIDLLEEKRQAIITEAVTKGLNPTVKMKDSGVEWIGEIPEHWRLTKMKYIGDAITGLTYSPNDVCDEYGTVVLRSTNIQKGNISLHDNVYVNMNIPGKLFTKVNDILICSRNGSRNLIGKNALILEKHTGLSFGAFTTVFRSEYNSFVYYVLNSGFFAAQLGTYLTSTINQLTIGNLNNMEIVMPPLKEQKKITQYLQQETSNLNHLIERIEEQIQKLKEYRQSLIYEVVTGKIDVRDLEVVQ